MELKNILFSFKTIINLSTANTATAASSLTLVATRLQSFQTLPKFIFNLEWTKFARFNQLNVLLVNTTTTTFVIAACFGSVCQEVLYWFELRKKLDEAENQKLLKSKYYWVLTFLMIVISGFGTWLLFYDDTPVKLKIPFVLGAAFPYLFKKIVQATQEKELPHLGKGDKVSFKEAVKKYFQ